MKVALIGFMASGKTTLGRAAAVRLGIQPSNISHLLSGRNNPSLDFVRKLKETFPEYSFDWIILGQGPITVSEPFMNPSPVVESHSSESASPEVVDSFEGTLFADTEISNLSASQSSSSPTGKLKEMILVYDDNTFEVIKPR